MVATFVINNSSPSEIDLIAGHHHWLHSEIDGFDGLVVKSISGGFEPGVNIVSQILHQLCRMTVALYRVTGVDDYIG